MSNDYSTFFNAAQQEQWRGNYGEALQYYRMAIQQEPNRAMYYWEMVVTLIHLGMGKEARAAQEKAAQLDPEYRKELDKIRAKVDKPNN